MHHALDIRSKIIIMISVMASMFLVALDQTIVTTALGKIVEDFKAFDSLSWIITAYLLTTTVTVPIAGKLSDLFGRKIILLIGVAIFGIASLMSGMAGGVNELVIWRAIQGIGGGIITANAFTIIGDLFVPRERGRWQGMIGAVFGISSLVGPLLGGWLTDHQNIFGVTTSWHWIFWINVPIALAACAIIMRYCPPLRHNKKPQVDYIGAALLTVGLATLVLAVDNTEMIFKDVMTSANLSLEMLRVIMAGIVVASLGLFVRQQLRTAEPILPMKFFKSKVYSLIMIIAMLFGVGFMGSILYLTQFNQQVFGATPTQSGLMLLPMVAGIMIGSIGVGQLVSRTGKYKMLMQAGVILATVTIGLLTTLQPSSGYAYEAVIMVFLGLGLGLVMPVMNIAVQNEFEQRDLGAATSSIQLFRGLGSTIGIAVFGALLTAGITHNLGDMSKDAYIVSLKENPAAVKRLGDLENTNTLLLLNTPSIKTAIRDNAQQGIKSAPLPPVAKERAIKDFETKQDAYATKITQAFSDSLKSIFITSASLMFIAALIVAAVPERELRTTNKMPVISE